VKPIDSTFSEKLHLNEIRLTKAHCGKPIVVWVIGAWNLEIVCYLLFGFWNLLNLRTPIYLDFQLAF